MQMAYMLKGLMTQLTSRVRVTGFALCPALRTSAKSILTMMGYIMKNRQTAMGMETMGAPPTLMVMPSKVCARSGASLPRMMPATMQRMTQRLR